MFGKLNKFYKKILFWRKESKKLKILSAIILLFIIIFSLIRFVPVKNLKKFTEKQNSTKFYDSSNNLISILTLENGLKREYVNFNEIPEQIKQIFILAEDKNFYSHCGIDFRAVFRAIKQNSKENKTVSGASTITMQLARLINPRKSKVTIFTKFKEMFSAVRLELQLSKNEILELYLNNIPFGNQIEGISSAAREFFGKNLNELSTEQILCLSVIPRRPAFYSPVINPENSYLQAELIAKKFGYKISKDDWITENQIQQKKSTLNAPHYINFIKSEFKKQNKIIPNKVKLNLDLELTSLIEKELSEQLELYSDSRIQNASALVFDNKNLSVIAWVGNPDFFNKNSGQVDGIISKHQSGSSSKPFLYALALENGYKPNQILKDIPKDYGEQNVYVPLNFNNMYNGPQSMRVSLASSLNIPAVDILYNLGVDKYFNFLLNLEFNSLESTRNNTGLSLALGSSELTLLELTRAFTIFANDGILKEITFFEEENNKKSEKRIIKTDTARIICDFLKDRSAQSLGFGNAKVFNTKYPAIFKTGTANQFQDIISLCSTSKYTVGVWMGNLNGETVIKKTGSSIPAEVCRKIQDYLFEKEFSEENFKDFPLPKTYKKEKICSLSGLKPNKNCKNIKEEFIENISGDGYKNLKICDWHYNENGITKIKYPSEFQHWAKGKNINSKKTLSDFNEKLQILYPTNNSVFYIDDSIPKNVQKISILCSGGKEILTESYLDGFFYESTTQTQNFQIQLTKGPHNFTIKNGNEKVSVNFEVK